MVKVISGDIYSTSECGVSSYVWLLNDYRLTFYRNRLCLHNEFKNKLTAAYTNLI